MEIMEVLHCKRSRQSARGKMVLQDMQAAGGGYSGDPWGGKRWVDAGPYYAAKDFYDPVKRRRLLWGLIKDYTRIPTVDLSVQSLPR